MLRQQPSSPPTPLDPPLWLSAEMQYNDGNALPEYDASDLNMGYWPDHTSQTSIFLDGYSPEPSFLFAHSLPDTYDTQNFHDNEHDAGIDESSLYPLEASCNNEMQPSSSNSAIDNTALSFDTSQSFSSISSLHFFQDNASDTSINKQFFARSKLTYIPSLQERNDMSQYTILNRKTNLSTNEKKKLFALKEKITAANSERKKYESLNKSNQLTQQDSEEWKRLLRKIAERHRRQRSLDTFKSKQGEENHTYESDIILQLIEANHQLRVENEALKNKLEKARGTKNEYIRQIEEFKNSKKTSLSTFSIYTAEQGALKRHHTSQPDSVDNDSILFSSPFAGK